MNSWGWGVGDRESGVGDKASRFDVRFFSDSRPPTSDSPPSNVDALTAVGDRAPAEPLLADFRRHNVLGTLLHRAKIEGLNDETLALRIGLACAEAGRPLEARAWLNWFIARNPLEPRAQAALRRLERAAPAGERPSPARP